MKVLLACLADAANIGEGEKLNILGVFETVAGPKEPVIHLKMCLVLSLKPELEEVQTGEQRIKAVIVNQEGKVVWNPPGELTFRIDRNKIKDPTKALSTLNTVMDMVGIRFDKFGEYKVQVQLNNKVFHELPIEVRKLG